MSKLWKMHPISFYIFTSTPEWFFKNSNLFPFEYIQIQTDVGLVQLTPFEEDIEKTVIALEEFIPFSKTKYESFIHSLSQMNLDLILCDISPLGLWVAEQLAIPSVLIENFTWDWIYENYLNDYPVLNKFSPIIKEIFQFPDLHFSCEPYCCNSENSIKVAPVFREPKSEREKIRKQLGIKENEELILITMGGIPIDKIGENNFLIPDNLKFLIPVNNIYNHLSTKNIIYLPHNHPYFHPDLVNASDLVIGKLGYSTIAEVYSLNKPFLYIGRESFRESKILEKFVLEHLIAEEVNQASIFSLETLEKIQNSFSKTKIINSPINGAYQIAETVLNNYPQN
jgi:hypothetical protein